MTPKGPKLPDKIAGEIESYLKKRENQPPEDQETVSKIADETGQTSEKIRRSLSAAELTAHDETKRFEVRQGKLRSLNSLNPEALKTDIYAAKQRLDLLCLELDQETKWLEIELKSIADFLKDFPENPDEIPGFIHNVIVKVNNLRDEIFRRIRKLKSATFFKERKQKKAGILEDIRRELVSISRDLLSKRIRATLPTGRFRTSDVIRGCR